MIMSDDIAKRNQTEEALRDANQFNIEIVFQAGEGIIVYDRDLRYVVWNRFMERMTGALAEDVIGRNGLDVFPHLHEQGVDQLLKRALNGETVTSSDLQFYCTFTDQKGWVVGTYSPHRNARGEIIGVIATLRDITERKRAEEALRDSENRLATIIEFLPDATLVINLEGKVVAWNRAMEEMTGVGKDDMIGQGDHAYTVPFYGERRLQLLDLLDKDDKEIASKYQYVQRKGDTLYAETFAPALHGGKGAYVWATGGPIFDVHGNRTGAIESIRDITERKRTEDALRESEQRLANIIDFLPDATFAVDLEGKVIAWNRAIEEMTGTSKDAMLNRGGYAYGVPFYGEPRPILIDLVSKDQKEIESTYNNFLRKGDHIIAEASTPMLNQGKGAYLWAIAAPLYDRSGSIIGAIESIRDITERKQMEVAVRESKDYLDKIINSIGDPIFVIDRQHRHVLVNDALCSLTNRTREELIGKTPYDFYSKEQVDVFLQKDEAVFETGEENVNEEIITDSHGVARTIVTKKTLYIDASGNKSIVGIIRDITDRKKAEEELRRSEEHLRLATEGGELGTYTYDFISGQGDWSPELKAFYGLRADEPLVLDEDWVPIALHPEDRSAFLSAMIAANDPYGNVDGILELDYRIIRTDGSTRWQRVHGRTEFIGESNNRRPWRAAGVVTDITKHKFAEEALKESRMRYELAIQSAQMGSWVLDVVENKRDFDAQTCHLLGIDHATFKGSPEEFFRVVHPNDRDTIEAALTRSIEHDAPYESAYRVIHPDGSIRHIVARGRIIRDQNRKPLKLIGIIWDNTDHGQAEEALRTSHRILDGIINAIPVRVFWKDKDLVYLGCNAIFAHDAGFADSKDIVGKDDYQMGWRDQAELYRADDRQVIESGRPKLFIEEPQTTPEGNTIVLLTSKIPLRNSEGEIIGVLGTYMDITDRKQMESELRRSRDDLELRVQERTEELASKNAEMERFVYTVSHDLRTPLISMSGFLGFLKQDAENGDMKGVDEDFRIINGAITKMDKLLQDTLELSRIGRIVNPPENVPFGEIVSEALAQSSAKLNSNNVRVTVEEDLPIVQVDRMRLVEVLVNLLENSMKYMGDQPQPEIEIGKRLDGENTVFFVRDNGIGIDPSQHDKVFELFYKVNQKSDGSGAGLAIGKKIIEVHGGSIWIESELGKGCTVCFTLEPAKPGYKRAEG